MAWVLEVVAQLGRTESFRHCAVWFRPFVEHLVCRSKKNGCKTTLDSHPTPCKTNKNQHKSNPFMGEAFMDCFSIEKVGELWKKTKKKIKLGKNVDTKWGKGIHGKGGENGVEACNGGWRGKVVGE